MTKSKCQRSHVRIKYKLLYKLSFTFQPEGYDRQQILMQMSNTTGERLSADVKDDREEISMQMSKLSNERLSADVKDDRQEISMQMSKLSNERLSADVKDDRFQCKCQN